MATQPNDGGPAFPREGPKQTIDGDWIGPTPGMSLLDWFAGKAPAMPTWFGKDIPTVAKRTENLRPKLIDDLSPNERLRRAVRDYRQDQSFDLRACGETDQERAWLEEYASKFDEYADACEDARIAFERECYFAWRWHYADAMLAERERRMSADAPEPVGTP